jgi:hypothetical protein
MTTIAVLNPDTATAAITMPRITHGNYAVIDTRADKVNVREAFIQDVAAPDPTHAKTIRLGRYQKPDANDGIGSCNSSVKLETFVAYTDAEGIVKHYPATVVVALTVPGLTGIVESGDPQDTIRLIGECTSVFAHAESGDLQDDVLSSWQYGLLTTPVEVTDNPI